MIHTDGNSDNSVTPKGAKSLNFFDRHVAHPHYWDEIGPSIVDFQYFASIRDWQNIIFALARSISEHVKSKNMLNCLDYGCGFSYSLKDIIAILNFDHNVNSRWIGYDPDEEIIDVSSRTSISKLQQNGFISGVYNLTSDWRTVKNQNKLDCVMSMHSLYYPKNALLLIKECFDTLLKQEGFIVVLRLSKNSPFYVLENFRPDNGVYEIEDHFNVEVKQMEMNFKIPNTVLNNKIFIDQMFSFMSMRGNGVYDKAEFERRFQHTFCKTTNLQDEICVIRRR